MSKGRQEIYNSKKGHRNFHKSIRRAKRDRQNRIGFERFVNLLRQKSKLKGEIFLPPEYVKTRFYASLGKKPDYDEIIQFLIPKYLEFSDESLPSIEDGLLKVPETFSLSETPKESMLFLKRLFNLLYKQLSSNVIIDYQNCKYLDVDASACMDIILAGFISFFNKCNRKGHKIKIDRIKPINLNNSEVKNVLFSIGAYKNLRGFELKNYSGFIPFALRIGDSHKDSKGTLKEIHETEIVDYVLSCLGEMRQTLTADAESHLSKVVGEVMANAEEHSNFRYRYAIGYFLKPTVDNNHGTFKLAIFNFGQTIYESFKRPECQEFEVVKQMKALSTDFTKKGIFRKAEYEEQTLWTLYALQEGVTSTKDWKRGKGTIRFIDRFFKLKGDQEKDNLTKLSLTSGNTRIIFDGTYPLIEVKKGKDNKKYQMMTFNHSGDIHEKPNNKYVTFAPQYFPGTLISAKICLKYHNIENN